MKLGDEAYNTRQKSWNTCLFPLPQCWFGYHSGLSTSKSAWLNIGEGEGTFQVGKQCGVQLSGFFQKNSGETVSVSTICDEYCSFSALQHLWCNEPCFDVRDNQ